MSNSRLYIDAARSERSDLPASVFACGLRPVATSRLPDARRLAQARMGVPVAPLPALRRACALAPNSIMVFEESGRITGVLGVLPLTVAGVEALCAGGLDLGALNDKEITNTFDQAAALYAMGIAAETKGAARAVVTGVVRLRDALSEIPFYARPVTDDGRRILVERLGCLPRASSPLMVSPASPELGAAA